MFARIAVNIPTLTGVFDYNLPDELAGRVDIGHLVTIPFGKQTVQGVVLELLVTPSVASTKTVLDLLAPLPVLTAAQIALAQWLAGETLSPLAACLGLMLPVGLAQQADVQYAVISEQTSVKSEASQVQKRLLELLAGRGPLRGRQIDRHFKNVDWRKTAQYLVRTGVLTSRSILPSPSIRPKYIRTAQLSIPLDRAEAVMPDLGKTTETLSRRQAALRFLMREPADVNVAWVYAESGCNLTDLQELAERELIVLRETEIWRDPLEKIGNQESGNKGSGAQELKWQELTLTIEQEDALNQILQALQPRLPDCLIPDNPFLLHGVTGSGKTEIYIRAAQECIRCGKQAIILVPEIALTPQTVRRFLVRFPGQVGLVHSRLSEGERYDTWRRARLGQLKVIIGPRSALFTPLPNIGLIVADECHDSSYYQAEPPFYSAVSAAMAYARLCAAVCILGSATPSIVQRYQAEVGEIVRLALPKRIVNQEMPPVQVVDMRAELKSGNRGIFSQALVDALDDVLKKGQQAILFLNRRGTATYVFCRECGYTLKCPKCDTPLTYHVEGQMSDTGASRFDLRCHRCSYTRQMPKKCPECGSDQIRQFGLGSEKVETEVRALFPSARTLRWDWDTTRRKDSHEIILSHFTAHRADVLIGTQMLAKGLDLPLVTLVGIVLADLGLNLPDPFGAERTFDVLTQVSGRAGRSSLGGRVVLQTFQPEHYVIQAAASHNYAAFYVRELDYRKRLGYPPFNRLVRMEYRHVQAAQAESEAQALAARLSKCIDSQDRRETTIIGPAPCFFSRLNGLYRWQIILRGPNPASLLQGKTFRDWRVEVDPPGLL